MIRVLLAAGLIAAASTTAVAQGRGGDETNRLTHGMVTMTLKVGSTTQGEVIDKFGAPNIATTDGTGQEMWVYDRQATVSYDKSSGFSIGLLVGGGGGGVGAGGGLGFGTRKSKSTTSSRTMMLVIKFDQAKVVSDFKSRSSSF